MNDTLLIRDECLRERECYESFTEGVRKGVLRVIKGPIGEWGDKNNRNGRRYTEPLWDRAINSDYIQEQLKYHTLLGEANHPVDRFEVDFSRVSHAITSLWKVPETQTIHGTIEILDTPLGRILDTLYEAGAIIGYSSRAGGTLKKKNGYIEVDEDSYRLITFDAVPYPSAAVARPGVNEGVEYQSLESNYHDKLCSIINESGIGDREVIKDFIYSVEGIDFSAEKSALEGVPLSEGKNGDTPSYNIDAQDIAVNVTTQNVVSEQVTALEVEKSRIEVELASKQKEICSLNEAVNTALKRIANLSEELSAERGQSKNLEGKYRRTIAGLQSELSDMSDIVEDFKLEMERYQSIEERYNELVSEQGKVQEVPAPVDAATLIKEYEQEVVELSSEVDVLREENASLTDAISDKDAAIASLKERIAELGASVRELATAPAEVVYREVPVKVDVTESASADRVAELEGILESMTAEMDGLRKKAEDTAKTDYAKDLVLEICASYDVDGNSVMDSLHEGFTRTDVHLACEKLCHSEKKPIDVLSVDSTEVAKTNPVTLSKTFSFTNRRGIEM